MVPLNAAPCRPAPAMKAVGWVQAAVLFGCATSAVATDPALGRPVAKAKVLGEMPGAKAGIRLGTLPPMLVVALAAVVLPTVPLACAWTWKTGPVPGVVAFAEARPEEPVAV